MKEPDKRWTCIKHNLAIHKLTAMRDKRTDAHRFRRLTRQMGLLLCSEMTRDLELSTGSPITTPEGHPAKNERRDQTELVVMPVLRAGLPLSEAFLELLPRARVGHVGIYRDDDNEHHCYMLSIPKARKSTFFVLDPLITQGETPAMAVDYLIGAGIDAKNIRFGCLIACEEGLRHFYASTSRHDVRIFTFDDKDTLSDEKFLVPGMGNVGSRLFLDV